MKKHQTVVNIVWTLGIFLLLIVILEQREITHFLPIYLDPYTPTTTAQIKLSNLLTLSISCTGYLLLAISLILKIVNAPPTKQHTHTDKPISITIILISLKVVAIIITLLLVAFSLLLAFFSFLGLMITFDAVCIFLTSASACFSQPLF